MIETYSGHIQHSTMVAERIKQPIVHANPRPDGHRTASSVRGAPRNQTKQRQTSGDAM